MFLGWNTGHITIASSSTNSNWSQTKYLEPHKLTTISIVVIRLSCWVGLWKEGLLSSQTNNICWWEKLSHSTIWLHENDLVNVTLNNDIQEHTLLSFSPPSFTGSIFFSFWYPMFILCMRRRSLLLAISRLILRSFSTWCLFPLKVEAKLQLVKYESAHQYTINHFLRSKLWKLIVTVEILLWWFDH